MKKTYLKHFKSYVAGLSVLIVAASCKKERLYLPPANNFATIGLYEQLFASDSRRVFIHIAKLGNVTADYLATFDTGSPGMVIDGNGILPASMITAHGFMVPGDSVVYNGITVTNIRSIITYGGIGTQSQVYGNLAYATVTVGENSTTATTTRIPFFIYYKAIDVSSGLTLAPHDHDVFGVGIGFNPSYTLLDSPLGHIKMPVGVDPGFKMGLLDSASFTAGKATYLPGLLTIGLTQQDVFSSGFVIHANAVSGNITYNGQRATTDILMDTGTPAFSILEDPAAANSISYLAAGTKITISTPQGFNYTYTTGASYNITEVENTSYSNDVRNVFSIDFFKHNEYLVDYSWQCIGLKNN